MIEHRNHFFIPLIAVAAISVVAFGGIGIAAITGHLSIAHSNLNPFAGFSKAPANLVQAPVVAPSGKHRGITRRGDEIETEGKPVNYQFGARIPGRKQACPDCGVVNSIDPRHAAKVSVGFNLAPALASPAENIMKTASEGSSNTAPTVGFVVRINMENGTVRTLYETERPEFNVGERIKLVNGAIIRIG